MPWVGRSAALKELSGYRAEMTRFKVMLKNLVAIMNHDPDCWGEYHLPIKYVMSGK